MHVTVYMSFRHTLHMRSSSRAPLEIREMLQDACLALGGLLLYFLQRDGRTFRSTFLYRPQLCGNEG